MGYPGSLFVLLMCAGLFACGGSTNTPPDIQQSSSQQSSAVQSSVLSSIGRSSSSIANVENPITRQTAPLVVSTFADVLELSNSLSEEIYDQVGSYRSIPDSAQTISCDKGSVTVKISNNGLLLNELYKACQLDGTELNGERVLEVVSVDSATGATINYSYKRLSASLVSEPLFQATVDGSVAYVGRAPGFGDSDSFYSLTVNLTIDDAQEGRLEIKNFGVEYGYRSFDIPTSNFHENLIRMKYVSGNIAVNNTRFSVESVEHGVLLKGDNNSRVSVVGDEYSNTYISWDKTGDGLVDASLTIPYSNEFSIADMMVDGGHKTTVLAARNSVNQIYEGAQIYMGRGSSADVYVHWNFTNTSASLLNYELNGKATNGVEWTQLEAGHFRFSFPSNQVDTNYDLTFTATDTEGNKSPEVHAKIYVGVDTDKDGIPDVSDNDDDGDGTIDKYDAFPFDSKESSDADGDDIGDNTDPDADFSVQRGLVWFVDKNGVVYFTSNSGTDYEEHTQKRFSNRWDPKTNTFLEQLVLPNFDGYLGYYSSEQNRLYYTSFNNDIYYINLADMQETLFVGGGVSLQAVNIVIVKSNNVVVSRSSNEGTTYETYNEKGQFISSITGNDSANNAIPFYSPELAAFCSFYISFDSQGKLYQYGSYGRDKCSFSYISVSQDGSYVYRGRGVLAAPVGIYAADGSILTEISSGSLWLANNLVVRNEDNVVLYNTQGVEIKRYSLPFGSSIETVISNSNQLVFLLRLADYSRKIVVLDANLEFISEYVLPASN